MHNPLAKWIHGPTFAVAMTSLGGEFLGVIFSFYYVKVYLNLYHLEDKWMNISQILFMVWNAVNDPLFGFIQDFGCGPRCLWITKRRKVILYCGPIFALTFMVPWIPWSWGVPGWLVGLHLITSLFVFDALLSLVLSAQCGLFTELTTEHAGRVRVVVYMEVAALVASFSIFPVDKLSKNLDDFRAFQICSGVVAVISTLCFIYSGLKSPKEVAQVTNQEMSEANKVEKAQSLLTRTKNGLKTAVEILSNRNWWSIVLANFFHIMRNVANANFLAIYTEALISPYGVLPRHSNVLSLFYTAAQVVPKFFLALSWPLLQRFGAWVLTMLTIALTVVNSLVAYFVGRHFYSGLAIFFLVENILCRALWPAVYNIFFPDIIDEDLKKHKRKSPISTLIFTMNALLTKPAISVAPIIITACLSTANYHTWKDSRKWDDDHPNYNGTIWNGTALVNSTETPPTGLLPSEEDSLFNTMFLAAVFFPLACGLVEAFFLLPYTLKFRHRRDNEEKELESMTTECSKI